MANTAPNCKIDVLIHSTTLANTPQSVMQTEINTRNVMQMENWRANAADLNPHRRVKIASVIVYSQNGNSWRVVNQGVGQNSHMALVTLLSLYEDYLSERYGMCITSLLEVANKNRSCADNRLYVSSSVRMKNMYGLSVAICCIHK